MNFIILYYSLGLFLLLGFIGYKYYASETWKYIDILYYPLGAIGILMLFMQEASYRHIMNNEEKIQLIQYQSDMLNLNEPDIANYMNESIILQTEREHLQTISRYVKACDEPHRVDMRCIAAENVHEVTKKYEKYFNNNDGVKAIEEICSASYHLMDELDKSDFPSFLVKNMKTFYMNAIDKGYSIWNYEDLVKYLNEYKNTSRQDIDEVMSYVDSGRKNREEIKALYMAYMDFGFTILNSFKGCARAPEKIRNGEYSQWKHKVIDLNISKNDLLKKNSKLVKKNSYIDLWFHYFIWPYIIILALSLKFGKGVSTIRK